MKYTKEQRLEIGRQIYDNELSRYEAAERYNISDQTARDYMRMYRDVNHLPPKKSGRKTEKFWFCMNYVHFGKHRKGR